MFRLVVVATTAMILAATRAAVAAPQIIGLVATSEPVPMQCDGGECSALLSAFCLQEKRLPPDFYTTYRPADEGQIVLVVTGVDGRIARLPAGGLVDLRSRYGYTAVEARLPVARLGTFSPASIALEVSPRAALIPIAQRDDPQPLTPDEIALATGPWRLAAETELEGDSEGAAGARAVIRLINALPTEGDIQAAEREPLWRRVAAGAPATARRIFDACGRSVDQAVGYPLRQCLEERHEKLQVESTRRFWRSLGGS